MTVNERVIIVENGEYKIGYRTRNYDNSPKIEKRDNCFENIIDFKKVRTQAKQLSPKFLNRNLKKFYSGINSNDLFNILKSSVNSLSVSKEKMDLLEVYNSFLDRVYSKNYYSNDIKDLNRQKDILLNGIFDCPDLTLSVFVKAITKDYCSILLKRIDNRTIRAMEGLSISNNGSNKVLDTIMECIGDASEKNDYYNYRRKMVKDLLVTRFENSYNHLCGLGCRLQYFDICKKIHNVFWNHDITEYPFIKNGYQVEVEEKDGTWRLDQLIIEQCDFKNSNTMVPSKKLELLNQKK